MKWDDIRGALPHSEEKKDQKKTVPMFTIWGGQMDPEHVREEYPRPRLVRNSCIILNGLWNYAITKEPRRPLQFDGKILVPFSPEALLSGVNRQLGPDEYLWYERRAKIPEHREKDRILLHFEAVDQCAVVFVNGKRVRKHTGGYLPFVSDITSCLERNARDFLLTVCVQDFSDTSYHSRGKQKLQPGGMFYTAQSGIWQSVWMEVVPSYYIEDVLFDPDPESGTVQVSIETLCAMGNEMPEVSVRVYAPTRNYHAGKTQDGTVIAERHGSGAFLTLEIPCICMWSPDEPWLYPVEIRMGEDRVGSYFAMRTFSARPDEAGRMRIFLNGSRIFLNGVLDQGYWSDGLYTAPADEALVFDIKEMKALGFNMLRKHAKIEDRRWYYHCDRLGMIVWQDMVNGGGNYNAFLLTYLPTGVCVPGPLKTKLTVREAEKKRAKAGTSLADRLEYRITGRVSAAGRTEFRRECGQTVDLLRGYPCIMTWVIFNEGWGQFETGALTDFVREKDPDRLIDSASGWFEHKTGDFKSVHNYFRKMFVPKDIRANILSEYGGAVYHVEGHSMYENTYGYHTCGSAEEFRDLFWNLVQEQVLPLEKEGLCGAVYTQVSDIEEETNGLLTYDRKLNKLTGKEF